MGPVQQQWPCGILTLEMGQAAWGRSVCVNVCVYASVSAGNGPGKNEVSRHGGGRALFSGALGTTTNKAGSMCARSNRRGAGSGQVVDGYTMGKGTRYPRAGIPSACTTTLHHQRRQHTYWHKLYDDGSRPRTCMYEKANFRGTPTFEELGGALTSTLHRPLLPYRSSAIHVGA